MNALLDYFNRHEKPSVLLLNPSFEEISPLGAAFNIQSTLRFNGISEVSFDYPMSIDGGLTKTDGYDNLKVKMVVQLTDVGRYIISECPESSDGSIPVKRVVAQSLESELLYKRVTALSGTFKFVDTPLTEKSLMGKIMKLIPGWYLGEIDEELRDMYRTFDVGSNTVYNFLTSDVANAFSCVFVFDPFLKTINAKLIKNLEENTGAFMSLDNTGREITITEFSDEICTALHAYGGTNLDIHSVNPLGTNVIYNFDYYLNDKTNKWMSDNLKENLTEWKMKVDEKELDYRAITLKNNKLITEYTEIKQLIEEYQSSLSALQLEKEGLEAIPTTEEDENTRLERLAELEKVRVKIANVQIAIRKARNSKAKKRKEIENNFSELRKIAARLSFTGEENWQAISDDLVKIIKRFAATEEQWQATIFETADNLEIDIPHFAETIPVIKEQIANTKQELTELLLDVSNVLYTYWFTNSAKRSAVSLKIQFVYEKMEKVVELFDSLIANTNMAIELTADVIKLKSFSSIVNNKDNLTEEEYKELDKFIFHNTYTNNNIITTDIMTEEEVQNQALVLYDQAKGVLKRTSNPRYELSGNFVSIINLKDFSDLSELIDFGKQVTIELPNGEQHADVTLLEISYNYDQPDSFTMTFSNRIKLNTSNFKFADMFLGLTGGNNSGLAGITDGNIAKSSTGTSDSDLTGTNLLSVTNALISKLGFVSFGPTPPQKYGNFVGAWLGYDKGAKFSLYSSESDYLQWTGDKLLIKAKNFTLDSNGNITANNADLAGKITAQTGNIGGWKIEQNQLSAGDRNIVLNSYYPRISMGQGVSGSMIGEGVFIGKDGSGYSFRVGDPLGDYLAWDENGIDISGDWIAGWTIKKDALYSGSGNSTVTIGSKASKNGVRLPAFSSGGSFVEYANPEDHINEIENIPFRVYHDGKFYATDAYISGSIVASSGFIGGWGVTSACILDTSGKVGLSSLVTSGDDVRFWAGNIVPTSAPFRVTESGKLVASNADVSGKITADEGTIGGWDIFSDRITSHNNTVGMDSESNISFWAGHTTQTSAPFRVTKGGVLVASNAYITGRITSSEGEIGGWKISSGSLTSPSNNVGMRSVGTSGSEVRFWAGASSTTTAPFRVTENGYLYANNAEIEGKITSGEGEIAGWSITTGCLIDASQKVGINSDGSTDESVRFWSGNANPSQAPFRVTQGGNLYADNATIKGEITADTGKVGSWNITTGCLISDSGTVGMRGQGADDSEIRFWAGNTVPTSAPFRVNQGGELYASNAEISGKVSSQEGNIGGWNISSGCIISQSNTVGLNSAGTSSSSVRFWAGSATPASAPFRVTQAGALVSTNATITGKITANSGTIGKWNIGAGSLVSVSGTVGMRGDGTGTDQIRFWAGNATPSNAPFRVTEGGQLHASNAIISGSISAETGSIGGWIVEEDRLINNLDGSNKVGLVSGSNVDNIAIFAGNQDPQNAPLKIKYDGTLFSTSAHIEGSIFSGSGLIGGWNITETAIEKGDISLDSNASKIVVGPKEGASNIVIDGNTGQIMSGNYGPETSGFTIAKDGNAEFNNARIRGTLSTSVFEYDKISAVAGTLGIFKSAGVLKKDVTTSENFRIELDALEQTFEVGDIIRFKQTNDAEYGDPSLTTDTWAEVISAPKNALPLSNYPIILVTGCGSDEAKGVFARVPTGDPYYDIAYTPGGVDFADAEVAIVHTTGTTPYWEIKNFANGDNYYHGDGSVATPDLVTEWFTSFNGSLPVPTVTVWQAMYENGIRVSGGGSAGLNGDYYPCLPPYPSVNNSELYHYWVKDGATPYENSVAMIQFFPAGVIDPGSPCGWQLGGWFNYWGVVWGIYSSMGESDLENCTWELFDDYGPDDPNKPVPTVENRPLVEGICYDCLLLSGTPSTYSAGETVIDYGSGSQEKKDGGFLYMKSGGNNGPYYSVRNHGGSPWEAEELVRIGSLKNYNKITSYSGSGAETPYGIAIGSEEDGYLSYDPTNGLRVKGNITITGGNVNKITNYYPSGTPRPLSKELGGEASQGDYYIDNRGVMWMFTGYNPNSEIDEWIIVENQEITNNYTELNNLLLQTIQRTDGTIKTFIGEYQPFSRPTLTLFVTSGSMTEPTDVDEGVYNVWIKILENNIGEYYLLDNNDVWVKDESVGNVVVSYENKEPEPELPANAYLIKTSQNVDLFKRSVNNYWYSMKQMLGDIWYNTSEESVLNIYDSELVYSNGTNGHKERYFFKQVSTSKEITDLIGNKPNIYHTTLPDLPPLPWKENDLWVMENNNISQVFVCVGDYNQETYPEDWGLYWENTLTGQPTKEDYDALLGSIADMSDDSIITVREKQVAIIDINRIIKYDFYNSASALWTELNQRTGYKPSGYTEFLLNSKNIIDNYKVQYNNITSGCIFENVFKKVNGKPVDWYLEESGDYSRGWWNTQWGNYYNAESDINLTISTMNQFPKWNTLTGIPMPLQPVPNHGSGLYLTDNYLGFYDYNQETQSGLWKTYIDNSGNFKLGGDISNGETGLTWSQANSSLLLGNADIKLYQTKDGETKPVVELSSNKKALVISNDTSNFDFGSDGDGVWMGHTCDSGSSCEGYKFRVGEKTDGKLTRGFEFNGDDFSIMGADIKLGTKDPDAPSIWLHPGGVLSGSETSVPYISIGNPATSKYDDPESFGIFMGQVPNETGGVLVTNENGSYIVTKDPDGSRILVAPPKYAFRVGNINAEPHILWDGDSLSIDGANINAKSIVAYSVNSQHVEGEYVYSSGDGEIDGALSVGNNLYVFGDISFSGSYVTGIKHNMLENRDATDAHPQYLLTSGTAADSSKLGGVLASSYLTSASGVAYDSQRLGGVLANNYLTSASGVAYDSQRLGGVLASSYLTSASGVAYDSSRLGGTSASDYALKSDIPDIPTQGVWTAWTPSVTGWSSTTTCVGAYKISGDTLEWTVKIEGTSNSSTTRFTLPMGLKAKVIPNLRWSGAAQIKNNSTIYNSNPGQWFISANGSTSITFRINFSNGGFTASGNKEVTASGTIGIHA